MQTRLQPSSFGRAHGGSGETVEAVCGATVQFVGAASWVERVCSGGSLGL